MSIAYRSRSFQDGAFLFGLGAVALYGLHDSFSGWSYLTVGLLGLAFGIALAVLVKRLKQPLIVLAVLVPAAFFILGGAVALHGLGGTAFLPVPQTLSDLANAAVHGWKDMLTTLPPVDNGTLLTLPYLLGLVAGALGMVVAERTRWVPAPALVVGALLVVVILLGVQHPSHADIYGALFAGGALAWMMVRAQRGRPHYTMGGNPRISRRVYGAVLCGGVTVLAALIGTQLPGFDAGQRSVLRSVVVAPFNVGQYPSPLAGFRRFTHGYTVLDPQNGLYNTPLFKVSGLRAGDLIRIATLDSYDGNVWGAGDVAGSVTATGPTGLDTFQKVGQVIDNPQHGTPVIATVKILSGALSVWVPTAGALTGITFTNPTEQVASSDFRYNLATSAAVMPQSLRPGDVYTFHAVIPSAGLTDSTQLASGSLPEVVDAGYQQLATRWAGHAAAGLQQIDAVASYLRANGHYTNGGVGSQSFAAGESLYRLNQFVSTSGELAGDDEQFSALMALMANELGVPARVVLGAEVPANGVVTGADVHAWVELQAADGTWKTLPQTAFMATRPPKKQSQRSQPSVPTSVIPPPAPVQPPATAGQSLTNTIFHRVQGSKLTHPLPVAVSLVIYYVGGPLLALMLLFGLILGLKRARRARRRRHGPPSRRLAYAWWDLLDHARDFGVTAPLRGTRREQAAALGFAGATAGAARLDAMMFGAEPPTDLSASYCWSQADALRRELAGVHGRWRRLRAALNPSTLRPRRRPRP